MAKIKPMKNKSKIGDIITIKGVKYKVLTTRKNTYKNVEKQVLSLKRLKGTTVYSGVKYNSGAFSEPISLSSVMSKKEMEKMTK